MSAPPQPRGYGGNSHWTAADVEQTIFSKFEQQARLGGDKRAISGTAWEPTFEELNDAANRHAHALIECGRREERIALLMRHDAPLVAALLGVLKAGHTVLALNPRDPPSRLGEIRIEAEPLLVITESLHRDLALAAGFRPEQVRLFGEGLDHLPAANPAVEVSPRETAFLVYTSGSTGRPKGVMKTHRQILHNTLRLTNGLGFGPDDRFALLGSLSWGQGVATTWTALLNGGTLCPFAIMDRGVLGLAAWIGEQKITVYSSSASVFRSFVRTLEQNVRFPEIRVVRLGSEPVLRGDFEAYKRHFPGACSFVNSLSSSETGNIAQNVLARDSCPTGDLMPVGRPAEGMEVLLLDEQGAEAGRGEVGEIVVRGDYLSPGYWKSEALTAQRFVSGATGNLFYSGDLGRWLDDGSLVVVGRKDNQVKIRGIRIELSEVEAAIARQPEVEGAAVCVRRTLRGDASLAAFVVARPTSRPSSMNLREGLRETLPEYMMPAEFAFLDAFPLTSHGKVDRLALARMAPAPRASEASTNRTGTEELVAGIWAECLEREKVGRDDDFFELGGDSLTAAVVAAKLHARLGVEIELGAFVAHPTVAALALLAERLRGAAPDGERPPLARVSRDEPMPLSFAQERCWRYSRTPEEAAGWTTATSWRIKGRLDVDALRESIQRIVRRHEILRTTFEERDGRPVQRIHPSMTVEVPLTDLTSFANAGERATELFKQETREPLDIERGPLLRLRLVRTRKNEHWLLRVGHHIISDGWSWKVFFRELGMFYEACRRGEPPPLPEEMALQYGDFAAWQRLCLRPGGAKYKDDVAWWKALFQAELPPLAPPFARSIPKEDAVPEEGWVWWGLSPRVSRRLDRFAREEGATHYTVRLAVFAAQLALETGQREIVLGSYFTNRLRVETQEMFGFFANLATLRLSFPGEPTFRQWVSEVRARVNETQARTEIPYEQLCEELRRDGVVPPEIRIIFSVSDQLPPLRFGNLEINPLDRRMEGMPWGFSLSMERWDETHRCRAVFDARLHDPSAVREMLGRYRRFLAGVCAEPDKPLPEVFRKCREEPAFAHLLKCLWKPSRAIVGACRPI